jgi:hypothetical protein
MIDVGTEEKLEKLVRLLSSDKEGEVVAAAHAIKRTLANAGSDIHELAERIKGGKLSESQMRKIYEAGYDAGVKDEKSTAETNIKFADVDEPSSHVDMARFCAEHSRGLSDWERNFVEEMIDWRRPSEKQLVILRRIYATQKRRQRR